MANSKLSNGTLWGTALILFVAWSWVWTPAAGFLGRGTLLENEGDIFNIYCKEFDRGTRVWHHREITREAVRRVIVKYFKEVPPSEGVYNHRDGMTLEEAYQEYYGPRASPQPFLYALSNLVDASASADSGNLGADPRYHFGSERFSESQTILAGRWARIVRAGLDGDYSAALYMLGLSLAAIQDFYSHTNWVEIGNKEFNPDVGLPGVDFRNVASPREGTCRDCPLGEDGLASCRDNILQEIVDQMKLTSGYSEGAYVNNIKLEIPRGLGKCGHGGSKDRSGGTGHRGGINKELPTACFSPHHDLHQQAAEEAIQATEFYLNLLRGAIGDEMFSRLLSLHPTPAIVLVLDTTDSMDEELKALTHVVSSLLERHSRASYPPAEYLLVTFNDPFLPHVIRSQRPDEIYEALTQLQAGGGGDEPEYSMSALQLAVHYAPPYSHVFLITDASIKDPQVFDGVLALAQNKKIQVSPVLTMPVVYGGVLGRNSFSAPYTEYLNNRYEVQEGYVNRRGGRPKRALTSYGKYLELAQRTGGQVIETPSDLVEETSKIIDAEEYPMAALWREGGLRSQKEIKIPIDSLICEFEVSISGTVKSAVLRSPTGTVYDLAADSRAGEKPEYSVVAITPYLIQVRLNMLKIQRDVGEWTLNVNPSEVSSLAVFARTSMDIVPTFYRPDYSSTQPSLQRIVGQPVKGITTYLDVVVTGADTAGLHSVKSAYLQDANGLELLKLDLPTTSPRRNTYLNFPTNQLRAGRFSVVVVGEDKSGHPFRRESGTVWEMTESLLEFPLGREVWGYQNEVVNIPLKITNTNGGASNTFLVSAYEAKGSLVFLSQRRVDLGRNESRMLSMEMNLQPSVLPGNTSTLVVTATSTRGDTSYAIAHLSLLSLAYFDTTPPTITVSEKTSCSGFLTPDTCSHLWSMTIVVRDTNPGLLKIQMSPDNSQVPLFSSGDTLVEIRYSATCCQPQATINAYDRAQNPASRTVDNGDVTQNLSAGAVSGIVLGSVAGLVILILIVVLVVRYCRSRRKEHVILRTTRRRASSE